jgi:hypothetical protein
VAFKVPVGPKSIPEKIVVLGNGVRMMLVPCKVPVGGTTLLVVVSPS